jgi:manganese transport protein
VILSLQLGFAIIPLIHFVSDRKTMGEFTIRWHVKVAAWAIAGILVFLNVNMVLDEARELFAQPGHLIQKILLITAGLAFSWLFVMMTFLPLVQRRRERSTAMHGEPKPLTNLAIPDMKKIAIALDFGDGDDKLVAHALAQGNKNVSYLLVHIVETVSAKYLGAAADDEETRKDLYSGNGIGI